MTVPKTNSCVIVLQINLYYFTVVFVLIFQPNCVSVSTGYNLQRLRVRLLLRTLLLVPNSKRNRNEDEPSHLHQHYSLMATKIYTDNHLIVITIAATIIVDSWPSLNQHECFHTIWNKRGLLLLTGDQARLPLRNATLCCTI